MQHAVGLGDLEQPVEHVFQHGGIAHEQLRDLAGIRFEAGHVLARQVEDAPDIGFFLRRHAEDAGGRLANSSSVTTPSAFAILPASAIIAMVKVTPGSPSRSKRK